MSFEQHTTKFDMQLLLLTCLSVFLFVSYSCNGLPVLSRQDPVAIHTTTLSDKFYTKRKKSSFRFYLSPFYQHTTWASRGDEESAERKKVPIGNIFGRWNMGAVFYSPQQANNLVANSQLDKAFNTLTSVANVNTIGKDLTNEETFDLENGTFDSIVTYQEVDVKYEKTGLRGQVSFDFSFGLGFSLKGGIACYKQTPDFTLDQTLNDALAGNSDLSQETANEVHRDLLSPFARDSIAKELGLNICGQQHTGAEDIHLSAYWHAPIKLQHSTEHEGPLSVIPYVSLGVWLPLAQDVDQNRPFSLSLGNDGYAALTIEASVALDFYKQLQVSIGGGSAFYSSRELSGYRVPTSIHQVGIIPDKTTVVRKPDPTWYFNVSLKAEDFSPGFSFHFDYIYTEHKQDSFTVKEPNAAIRDNFKPEILEKRSAWKHQAVNASLNYAITHNVQCGIAVQGTINSTRAYRPTTILGSLFFLF